MGRIWANGSGIPINATNLNGMESDLSTALGVPDAALASRINDTASNARGAVNGAVVARAATRDRAYRAWDSQLADPAKTPRLFVFGHSVVAGTGASVPPKAFARKLQSGLSSARSNAVVAIEGHGGYTTAQLLAALPGTFASQPAGSVGAVLLMGLLNDYQSQVATATTQSNISSIISTLRSHASAAPGMAVIIATEWLRSDVTNPAIPWTSYVSAANAAAAGDANTTVVDLGSRVGDVANSTAGIWYDAAHPNDTGHALIAATLESELLRGRAVAPATAPSTAIVAAQPPVANVAWIGRARDADNQLLRYSDATQNASITYQFVGDAGMYSIALDYRKQTNGGIYDLYIDGSLQGSGAQWDGYASANTDSFDQIDNFFIGTGGLHSVKLVMATKNASSTAYSGSIRGVYITRTGDLTT